MSGSQMNKERFGYGAYNQKTETLVPLSRVLSMTSNAIKALEISSRKAREDKAWDVASGMEYAKMEISVLFQRFIDLSGNSDNYQDFLGVGKR